MPRSTARVVVALIVVAVLLPILSLIAQRADSADPIGAPARGTRVVSAIAGEQVVIGGAGPQRLRRPVVLQRLVARRTWRPVDRTRTSPAGRYRFDLRARAATYQVVAPPVRTGSERLPAWASGRTTVRLVRQSAVLTVPATATSGERVTSNAVLAPARAGRPVRLQSLSPQGWSTAARATQDARGRATFATRATATTTYRVTAPAWRGAARVASAPRTVVVTDPRPGRTPWVTGYYAAWYWNWLYPPEEVDMSAMTHFVFGRMAPGGGSLGGEPGELVQGAWSAQEPGGAPDGSGRSIEDYLIDEAHRAGTRALLMLGGDGFDGAGFMRSSTDARRPGFVDTLVDYLVEHDYDGVDLDWENCLDGHADCGEPEGEEPATAAEAQRRLVALIDDVRAEMATRQRYAATPGLITFPGYTIKINENGGEPEPWQTDVALRVDQYNLMSYGIGTTYSGGGWLSWFSGALFGAGGLNPVDIASSVAAYTDSGVPRDRIGIGIGFYGVYFGPGITGPRQSTDENEIYETYDPALAYSELDRLGYLSHGEPGWDEEARSTYRSYDDGGYVAPREYDGEGNPLPLRNAAGFLSYEDERSIAAKGDWVKETGVGGTILWTINYGWLPETQTNPLLDAVRRSFLE